MPLCSVPIAFFLALICMVSCSTKCYMVSNTNIQNLCPMYRTTHLTPIQQNHTALRLQHFKPLLRYNCSVHSRPFICSSYVPFCYPSHPEFYVSPCHSLRLSVKSACLHCRQPGLANSFKLLSPPQSSAPLFWYFAIAIFVSCVAAKIITIFSTFAVTSHQLDSWTFSWFVCFCSHLIHPGRQTDAFIYRG